MIAYAIIDVKLKNPLIDWMIDHITPNSKIQTLITGADLGGFLRFPETGQVYSDNQNCILQ